MTILEVVAVISLCFTVFMFGFSVGKQAKKPANKSQALFMKKLYI